MEAPGRQCPGVSIRFSKLRIAPMSTSEQNINHTQMKKIIIILLAVFGLFSCSNQEREFPDFDYTAVYFPLQFPVRTLVLGHDRIDNSLDNALTFNVGVSIGGMYENTRDWYVDVIWDETLDDDTIISGTDTLKFLPQSYIKSMDPTIPGKVVIPSGSFNGLIEFQLTDAFLNDPLAHTNKYVIPLRITDSDADSILTGLSIAEPGVKASILKNSLWDAGALPRHYTLFMIKYVNMYHAEYFQRGQDVTYDAGGNVIQTNKYHEKYLVENNIVKLTTEGRYKNSTNALGSSSGSALLTFNGSTITVSAPENSTDTITGTGTFYDIDAQQAEEWGDPAKKFQTMYLHYEYYVS